MTGATCPADASACDNPGCRHGGCQGRLPERSRVNETAPPTDWFPREWSPTSLAGLEICPRRWALRRQGWKPASDPMRPVAQHAKFGQLWHAAAELFDRARFGGATLAVATDAAIEAALVGTWDANTDQPWAGTSADMWTCRDGIKRAASGRVSKYLCDGARDWWLGAPAQCPKCGGAVEVERRYIPEHPTKNRATLLRAVEIYCAEAAAFDVAGDEEGPILEREIHFSVAGIPCHMIVDRVSVLGSRRLGHERKTTARHPGRTYWDAMARTYQTAFYTIAEHVRDVLYEVVTIGARGCEVMRQIVSPDEGMVREVERAVHAAAVDASFDELRDPLDFLPRFASCATAAGGQPCEFIKLCNAAPAARRHRLSAEFICEPRRT